MKIPDYPLDQYTKATVDDSTIKFNDTTKQISVDSTITDAIDALESGLDQEIIDRINADAGKLSLDQTTPQAVINGSPIMEGIQFDITPSTTNASEGLLRWNATDGTLDLGMMGGLINLQIGQEMFVKVRNDTGATLTNGSIVYISGRTGPYPDVKLAKSDLESTSRVLGVITEDIPNTGDKFGYATIIGYVRKIKTNYTGAGIWGTTWVTGDILYVSKTTAGQLTNVEPSVPHHSDIVGTVGVVHGTLGSILIVLNKHQTLEELTDVNGTPLATTGQFPVWNQESGYFDFDYNITDYVTKATDQTITGIKEFENLTYFGNYESGNYSEFETDGTLEFHGNATTWDDLRVEPTVRGTGTRNPSFEQYLTNGAGSIGLFLYSFDDAIVAQEKEIYFTMQMPHSWNGTAISMHIHWMGNVDDTTAQPYWGMEYSWADIGTVFGNSQIVYAGGNFDGSGSTDPNITAFKHYISEFADITPSASQDGISSILIGRIFRNSSSVNDTYNAATNKCGLLYIDAHFQSNTIGSRDEYIK